MGNVIRLLYHCARVGNFGETWEALNVTYLARLWQRPFSGKSRDYKSYDAYIVHQGSKYKQVRRRLRNSYERRLNRFISSFRGCQELRGAVICLGARDGAEVEAMRELGRLAIGIDLEYPDKSPYVVYGDFNKIPFPESSFDSAYTNCFDHIYDPHIFLGAVRRVLKPGGTLVLDLSPGKPGAYESFRWDSINELTEAFTDIGWKVARQESKEGQRTRVVLQL